ncbi:YeeE/YedE family protein [Paracoccus caeni]|uniref:YeeE/YedE family protein n=1 Tax=Paracoccus caeni TaxID=657651 RepID=A0A934VZA8_9RHOB|nr:YeeE/YedE family protein [Paracoccus caeni]MBK4216857.1 YeeE/YedE family protein [Paracoccus caeni]
MNAVIAGLVLGLIFGAAARSGRFCLLRGMKGLVGRGDLSPLRAFALAIAVAILATQILALTGGTNLAGSLPMRPRFSWMAMLAGGAIFGLGMVMANACGARSVVLAAGGNLRSGLVLVSLALAAQASLTGVLQPLRNAVQAMGVVEPSRLSLIDVFAGFGRWPAMLLAIGLPVGLLIWLALPLIRNRRAEAAMAVIIGLVIAAGWWVSFVTDDPFDPKVLTSLSYVGPMGEGLLWLILSTGRELSFGVAAVAGTALGALVVAVLSSDFRLESIGSTGRAMQAIAGGVLMGFGGVLALGCSIGQGISGTSTLSLASLVAFSGILAGIVIGLVLIRSPDKETP